jgi:hypothetical protein
MQELSGSPFHVTPMELRGRVVTTRTGSLPTLLITPPRTGVEQQAGQTVLPVLLPPPPRRELEPPHPIPEITVQVTQVLNQVNICSS